MISHSSHNKNGDARLAIIAGSGRLPVDVALAAREQGIDPIIIAITGEADYDWSDFEYKELPIANFAQVAKTLKNQNVDRVVLAGGIRNRPKVSDIRITLKMLFSFPKLLKDILAGGDDALLRTTIKLFEMHGVTVVGAQDVVPNLLAVEGVLGVAGITQTDQIDIDIAASAASQLGLDDKGQAAVAINGQVVATEDANGTDAMLAKIADQNHANRLNGGSGVLVKLCKPQQDRRADLPTIGPMSVHNAYKAGLAGIAVEAGRSFILDKENVIKEADKYGLFVAGITRKASS